MLKTLLTKSLIFTVIVGSLYLYSSCSEPKEEKKEDTGINIDDDYYEFQDLDFAPFGVDAYISLPDETANIGASTKPEVLRIESHLWQIDVGRNFTIHMEDMAQYKDVIIREKKALKNADFFEVKYLIDEPDMIIYERVLKVAGDKKASSKVGVEHKSYHVYGQRTIDGITYALESREEGYEKKIIELMAKSIKSFKSKKQVK